MYHSREIERLDFIYRITTQVIREGIAKQSTNIRLYSNWRNCKLTVELTFVLKFELMVYTIFSYNYLFMFLFCFFVFVYLYSRHLCHAKLYTLRFCHTAQICASHPLRSFVCSAYQRKAYGPLL